MNEEDALRKLGYGDVADKARAASPSPEDAQRRIINCVRALELLEEAAADGLMLNQSVPREVLLALADDNAAAALWPMVRHKIPLH